MGTFVQGFPQFPDVTLDPKLYNEFTQIHLAINNLDSNVGVQSGVVPYNSVEWPSLGISSYMMNNVTRAYVKAGAAITAGQVVNIYNAGGVIKARPAKADSPTTFACGIANTSAAVIDTWIEVQYMRGYTNLIGGLTLGQIYYLSDSSAGLISSAKPVTVGHIVQAIGLGVDPQGMLFDISLNFTTL